jgi:hypothetical protein
MSNINDLIHTNARTAFEQGVKTEQQRIIKLLEETLLIHTDQKFFLIRSIKGESK